MIRNSPLMVYNCIYINTSTSSKCMWRILHIFSFANTLFSFFNCLRHSLYCHSVFSDFILRISYVALCFPSCFFLCLHICVSERRYGLFLVIVLFTLFYKCHWYCTLVSTILHFLFFLLNQFALKYFLTLHFPTLE